MLLHSCRAVTAPSTAMAANSYTCMRRLPWSYALAEPLGTPRLSPVAETLHPPAWTMLWWIVACLPRSKLAALPLTCRSLTTFHWSCVCSSLRLLHRHHYPQPRPPFLVRFGTAASEGPMQMPLHQGHARPLSTPVQLQPLLTRTAQQRLTLMTWSWTMSSCALPLMLQPKLHLFGAIDLGQGVSPHVCHATPGGIPVVSCFSHSCARPSFSAHAAPTSAFWNGDTRVTFDTAETALLSVLSWSFLSCSKATCASSGRWCAFPVCCCLRSSGTQLPGTPS